MFEDISTASRPIEAVGTSTAGFVGTAPNAEARLGEAFAVDSWSQFVTEYVAEDSRSTPLSQAIFGFFQNGGNRCYVVNTGAGGSLPEDERCRQGLALLEEIDEIAIVVAPGFMDAASYDALLEHCERLQDRFAILDAPEKVTDIDVLKKIGAPAGNKKNESESGAGETGASDTGGSRPRTSDHGYGAFYFPWILVKDPFSPKDTSAVPPSGHLAGIYARTDAASGVYKAPAGETVRGALDLTYHVTQSEQGELTPFGVNCLRFFPPRGILVWGARTLAESDSEWRYVPIRRFLNMVEESIGRGTRWVVFEPNDAPLRESIRRCIEDFLTQQWRQGALMGSTAREAFFVKCDGETNPPEVIDAGQVVIMVGIAAVKPAEFIVFRIRQSARGTQIEE